MFATLQEGYHSCRLRGGRSSFASTRQHFRRVDKFRRCQVNRRTCQHNYAMQKWAIVILEMDASHTMCTYAWKTHIYLYLNIYIYISIYLTIYLSIYRSISTWHVKYAGPAPGGAGATCSSGRRRLGAVSFPAKVKWLDCLEEILHLLTQRTASKLHNIALKACNFHPSVLADCMV